MKATIKSKPNNSIIDDHTASKIYAMCEKIWADPKIREGYPEWHLQRYGCLPEELKRENSKDEINIS